MKTPLKNPACLICDYVTPKDNEPYCTLQHVLTESLPIMVSLDDCLDRRTWVDRLPNLV